MTVQHAQIPHLTTATPLFDMGIRLYSILKSNRDANLLLPAYIQRLKRDVPVVRSVQHWSDQLESMLQDRFDNVNRSMFQIASGDKINEYTD